MSAAVLLATIFAGISAAVYYFFQYKFSYWSNRGVPYDPPKIPLGSLQNIKNVDLGNKILTLYRKHKKESPIVGMYFFTEPFAVVTDLELIKNIMIKDFASFHDRGIYYNEKDDPLSGHLFLLSGKKWKALRTKMSPTFTSGRMKFMFPTIVDVAYKFSALLSTLIQKDDELEVRELLARFTTDVIGTCAFGIECNSLNDPNAEFRRYGRKIFTEPRGTVVSRALKGAYRRTARFFGMKNVRDDVAKFFMDAVKQTVAYREKNNVRRNDFMDLLIQLKSKGQLDSDKDTYVGKLNIEELAAQAFVFFIAGFETSSTTMGYALYELALNQDMQEKLRTEITEVFKKYSNEFSYEAMTEMKYLEQVIAETLRKYPPVPIIFRETNENYQIPNSKTILEKGVRLFIPAYGIHHDPEIYPDPEKFDPSRFSPEQEKLRNSIEFLAFGDGPRNCIGLRFGKMQAKVGLIELLRNFRFRLGANTPNPLNLKFLNGILQVTEGIFLKAEKLQKHVLQSSHK